MKEIEINPKWNICIYFHTVYRHSMHTNRLDVRSLKEIEINPK